ncbi:lyase [Bosea sp. BK604]|uniref:Vgb family protein n=1 Tax=Bosea sp. BK604 TaxID=2512180 RepID=UPI001049B301|nr:lyase [Bosea sp. BK604]TCR64093.1 virginiamycin B lyase [Bosea sp. BK604]
MLRRSVLQLGLAGLAFPAIIGRAAATGASTPGTRFDVTYFDLPGIKGPHGLAATGDGAIWVCGNKNGTLGRFDPRTSEIKLFELGQGSAPRSLLLAGDGAFWLSDAGQNAILRVDPASGAVQPFKLPAERPHADLDAAVLRDEMLWFTGQEGVIGRLNTKTGKVDLKEAPRGRGVAGIVLTPSGDLWFASTIGNYVAEIAAETFEVIPAELPKPDQGPRRLASDSKSRIWVTETNSGNVSALDTKSRSWKSWKLPGDRPRPHAVYVDDSDKLWLSDFATNAIVHFDPVTEAFNSLPSDKPGAEVRHMHGRSGETWAAESGHDRLVRIQTVKQA